MNGVNYNLSNLCNDEFMRYLLAEMHLDCCCHSSRPSTAVNLCTLGLHKNYPRMILDYPRKFKLEQILFEKT